MLTHHVRPRVATPALPGHVHALLRQCQDTAEAAAEASAQAGEAAAAIRAPSHLLTAARAASAGRDASTRPAAPGPDLAGHPRERAGAIQDVLHRLGVTSPDLLQRAADIDRAGEQLIIEAAGRGSRQKPPSPVTPDRSATSPALADGAYASGDRHAASRTHHPASGRQHESPEAEP
ncbi:MAG: hypothetical protein ACLQB1_41160 [Streptosporangiaceae bacterium]